jgi:hypothetical protein
MVRSSQGGEVGASGEVGVVEDDRWIESYRGSVDGQV